MRFLISVIIPFYNAEKFIEESINSIINQSYRNLEIILLNDGSTDISEEIVSKINDSRIRYFRNNQNLGYLKSVNKLLSLATGDYIAFHDADDISAPMRLELQLNALEENGWDSCTCFYTRIAENGATISRHEGPTNQEEMLEGLPKNFDFVPGTALFRRDILDRSGLYNEYFDRITWEDKYWYALIILRAKVGVVAQHLYSYRSNSESVTSISSINERKVLVQFIVPKLIAQQIATGTDALETRSFDEIERWENQLTKSYEFYVKMAQLHYYAGAKKEAINMYFSALRVAPIRTFRNNLRDIFHLLRKG